jgi:general secretion pathway protein D
LNQYKVKCWLGIFAITALLSACAGTKAFKEGNALLNEGKVVPGLAKIQEAIKLEPENAEYRIALANRKLGILNSLNGQADVARQQGRLSDAEKLYQEAQAVEPTNQVARQGFAALVQDRRHKQSMTDAEALFKKGGNQNLQDALEQLRPILSENPNQRDALNLKSRISDTLRLQKTAEGRLAVAYRKPITLEFRDAPLRSVFDVIAKVSGLNFSFDHDVRPDLKATILARNTTIEDAVHMLLTTNQLEQSLINDNSILIYPNTPQKIKDYQQLTVRTFFLANGDVKTVSYTIKTLLKARDIVTDERLGLIIMRDTPEMIRLAERLIAVQDLSDPEVMLEVEVLEVQRSHLLDLGISWPDTATLSLAGLTKSVSGVTSQLTLEDLRGINRGNINLGIGNVTLNAKKTNADANILANPRIRVRNKEKAKILIGDRLPVVTTTSTATGFVADSVTYVDVGLKLDVEPNIYLDDEVGIKLNLEVSNIVKEVISKSGTSSYQIGTRNATTVLRLKDGETQVLAGLINDADRRTSDRVPVLGELPILNRLFGSQSNDSSRSEIVLSITPHILRSIRRPDLAESEFNSGSETNVGGHGISFGGGGVDQRPADGGAALNPGQLQPQGQQQLQGQPAQPQPIRSPLTGGGEDDDAPPAPHVSIPGLSRGSPVEGAQPPVKFQPSDAPLKPKTSR